MLLCSRAHLIGCALPLLSFNASGPRHCSHAWRQRASCLQCPLTNRADILMTAVTSIHPLKFLDSQTFTPIECSTMCKAHSEYSLHDSPSPTLARFKLPELSNSSTGSGLTLQLQTDSSNIITRRAEVYVLFFWNRSIAFLFLPKFANIDLTVYLCCCSPLLSTATQLPRTRRWDPCSKASVVFTSPRWMNAISWL